MGINPIHKYGKDSPIEITNEGDRFMGSKGESTPLEIGTATAFNALHFRFRSSAVSGYLRGMYLRTYLDAAGTASTQALRAFATIEADVAGGTGAHISLNFSAAGRVEGECSALGATLHVPNRAIPAQGAFYSLDGQIYCDGNDSDITLAQRHAILRLRVFGGNATARDLVLNAIALECSDGSGKMVYTNAGDDTDDPTGSIRILVNGAVKYLRFWDGENAGA